jgi:hypothetical protein
MIDVKKISALKAKLVYQLTEDRQQVHCEISFPTPFPASGYFHADNAPVQFTKRAGIVWIGRFTLSGNEKVTVSVDHPDTVIHSCTIAYNPRIRPVPYVATPFKMDVEVKAEMVVVEEVGA